MTELKENNRVPHFYSSHSEDERRDDYTNAGDMKLCAYCGFEFAGCYMHAISLVTRKGTRRELWRCNKCMEDMKSYKPTD